jgi:hypothetical protein
MISTYFVIGFYFFKFVVEYLQGVQNSIALTAQVYLITNALGGRRVLLIWQNLSSFLEMG